MAEFGKAPKTYYTPRQRNEGTWARTYGGAGFQNENSLFFFFLYESQGNDVLLEAKTAFQVVIQIVMLSQRHD